MALTGQGVIVTGAGSGIGRASALALAGDGARVVVADVRFEAVGKAGPEIRARGGEAIAVVTDVSDPAAVDTLLARGVEAFGQVHVLLNCAGISMRRAVLDSLRDGLSIRRRWIARGAHLRIAAVRTVVVWGPRRLAYGGVHRTALGAAALSEHAIVFVDTDAGITGVGEISSVSIGSMPEFGIGTAAQIHLGVAMTNLGSDSETCGVGGRSRKTQGDDHARRRPREL